MGKSKYVGTVRAVAVKAIVIVPSTLVTLYVLWFVVTSATCSLWWSYGGGSEAQAHSLVVNSAWYKANANMSTLSFIQAKQSDPCHVDMRYYYSVADRDGGSHLVDVRLGWGWMDTQPIYYHYEVMLVDGNKKYSDSWQHQNIDLVPFTDWSEHIDDR